MKSIIKAIRLNEKFTDYSLYEQGVLNGISKVNLFVGPNNSGKSRFLRSLASIKEIEFKPEEDTSKIEKILAVWGTQISEVMKRYGIVDYSGISDSLNRAPQFSAFIKNGDEYLKYFIALFNSIDSMKETDTHAFGYSGMSKSLSNSEHNAITSEIKQATRSARKGIEEITSKLLSKYCFRSIYIPTLRGVRTFSESGDIYLSKTLTDYPELKDVEIFSGQDMYRKMMELMLGDRKGRKIADEFMEYIGSNYFDGKTIDIIPNIKEKCLFVKIGDEEEYPIHNLGDGLQHILTITFIIFYYGGENVLLFIEEPELYLHPGLQRKLLENLMSCNNCQYFIATHSNHLLDMTLDVNNISVFTFVKSLVETDDVVKKAKFRIENVSNTDNIALELLGVNNSSVLLSNCTIWVEGITDRLYIRHYLDLFQKAKFDEPSIYKEDTHFSFIEYGGSNLKHWLVTENQGVEVPINVKYLCGKLFLISDNDNAYLGSAKDKLQKSIKAYLGNRYYLLKCKEIENIISAKVLKAVIKNYEKGAVVDVDPSQYCDKPLGSYIESLFTVKAKRKYASEYGAINDKVDFCKRVRECTITIEDLSEEAIDLCDKIYKFIKANNK